MKTAYIYHPDMLRHDTGPGHPESLQRLFVLEEQLFGPVQSDKGFGLASQLDKVQSELHDKLYDAVSQIHTATYIDALKTSVPKTDRIYLDPDTPLSPGSLLAAELAVSAGLIAVDSIMAGKIQNAFCAVRPPGHHAEAEKAMGFCLFNNIAIAAKYIQKAHHLNRVLIIDWDVHHGNGTQNAFYQDPSVFYFSTHQYPCYPGTGATDERGEGAGEGFTKNHPLLAGSGDTDLLSIFEHDLSKVASDFRPDFILISAGFDAHQEDPLASLEVTDEGFSKMTRIVVALAETHCQGRIISFLEGGYNLKALARSVEGHLGVLSGAFKRR